MDHYLKRLWLRPRLCHASDRILSHFNAHDVTTMVPSKHRNIWYSGLRLNSNWSKQGEELPAKSLFALFAPVKCLPSSLCYIFPLFCCLLAKLIGTLLTYLGRSIHIFMIIYGRAYVRLLQSGSSIINRATKNYGSNPEDIVAKIKAQ